MTPVTRDWRASAFCGAVFVAMTFAGQSAGWAQTMLQMPTGGVTGTYYMIGAPLAKFVNERSKQIRVTPNTSGGSAENIRRVDSGAAQLGMTQTDTMYSAWRGEKPFDKPMRNWRVIGVATPILANHVVALAKDRIRTASDLKGKIFAIGAPGSAAAVQMNLFLDHSGLKKGLDARMLPHQDYPTMLLDGKVQAINRANSIPAAVVDEIGVQKPITLVDFGKELEASGFLKKYPYLQKIVVKGGTYKGENRDVTFFGSAGYLIAHKDVPDAVVYEFTRLAYSADAVRQVNMAFAGANLNRRDPLTGNIGPVHPGAAKFWKEQGVTVPEPLLK
ncbi:MAG: TAXI family TRAP transporter solute-binding subunit [Betaproteobacteria bacterium]|nr:TAXI family TRAP transporter solute-binding subunit [Betaproteobacteria bacterium]